MKIIVKPFESIGPISLFEVRKEIRKVFNYTYDSRINEEDGTISEFYSGSMFEVVYKADVPVMIMINIGKEEVWFENRLISNFSKTDIIKEFRSAEKEIYTDGYVLFLFNLGMAIYFEEDDAPAQIGTFQKGTQHFDEIKPFLRLV